MWHKYASCYQRPALGRFTQPNIDSPDCIHHGTRLGPEENVCSPEVLLGKKRKELDFLKLSRHQIVNTS